MQRTEEAWFALFFIYYWRQWILSRKDYNNLSVTTRTFVLIKLNAHALIVLLVFLRDSLADLSSKCYVSWLLGFQPCVQTFHAARSMSNIFSTMRNFGVLGLLQRIHSLQIQLNLESKSSSTKIVYPR